MEKPSALRRGDELPRCCLGGSLHYSHVMLALSTVGVVMSAPGQSFGFSPVIDPIMKELNLTRPELSTLYFYGTLLSAVCLTQCGRFVDKLGLRVSILASVLGLGFSCLFLSEITYGRVTLFASFFLLRLFGYGFLPMITTTAINLWWVKKRGYANGISGSIGLFFLSALVPILEHYYLGLYGWRFVYTGFGLIALLVVAPCLYAFYRQRPELYGLCADAQPALGLEQQVELDLINHQSAAAAGAEREEPLAEVRQSLENGQQVYAGLKREAQLDDEDDSWTLAEARRTPEFWVLTFAGTMIYSIMSGVIFHLYSMLTIQEMTNEYNKLQINRFLMCYTASNILARVVLGSKIDKYARTLRLHLRHLRRRLRDQPLLLRTLEGPYGLLRDLLHVHDDPLRRLDRPPVPPRRKAGEEAARGALRMIPPTQCAAITVSYNARE